MSMKIQHKQYPWELKLHNSHCSPVSQSWNFWFRRFFSPWHLHTTVELMFDFLLSVYPHAPLAVVSWVQCIFSHFLFRFSCCLLFYSVGYLSLFLKLEECFTCQILPENYSSTNVKFYTMDCDNLTGYLCLLLLFVKSFCLLWRESVSCGEIVWLTQIKKRMGWGMGRG